MNKNNYLKIFVFIFTLFLTLFIFLFNKNINWIFYLEDKISLQAIYSKAKIFFDNKNLYLSDQKNKIFAINKYSGNISWIFENHGYTPYNISIDKETLYISSFDSHIYKLNNITGFIKWSFAIPNGILPDTEVVTNKEEHQLFFADRAGILYSLDKNDGQLLWTKKFKAIDDKRLFQEDSIHFGFITLDENYLYVTNSPQKEFLVIDKNSGNTLLNVPITFNFKSPIITNKKVIIPKSDYEYVVIDKSNLKIISTIKSENFKNIIYLSKIENNEKDVLLFEGNKITSIDLDNNLILWSKKYDEGYELFLNNPINRIILTEEPSKDGAIKTIELIDVKTGNALWSFNNPFSIESAILLKDKLFINFDNYEAMIFDVNSGLNIKNILLDGIVQNVFDYEKYFIIVSKDNSNKAIIYCLDSNKLDNLWVHKTDFEIELSELFQNEDRLYLISKDHYLIYSIKISKSHPRKIHKINFKFIENFGIIKPSTRIEKDINIFSSINIKLKTILHKYLYLIKNYFNIYKFNIKQNLDNKELIEIDIVHDQNFYNNVYQDVVIEATFKSNKTSQKIKGYYYDNNLWKIKFLPDGDTKWNWQINIKTPYLKTKKTGVTLLKESGNYKNSFIENDNFNLDGYLFFPIGIQDIIDDKNHNGNVLDQMGNAYNFFPEIDPQNYSYQTFEEYIKRYKETAGLNTFRINIDNWGPSLIKRFSNKNFIIDINQAKFVDSMIETLKMNDYKIVFSIFGFYPPYQDSEKTEKTKYQNTVKKYLDYIVSRYAQYIDIWEISNEASLSTEWQNLISTYIKNIDIYNRPITTSWEQKKLKNSKLLSIHWYSPIDSKETDIEYQISLIKSRNKDWQHAVLISEFGFDGASYSNESSEKMRTATWLSLFNKMGIIFWNQPLGILKNENSSNIYVGKKESFYLKNIQFFLPKMKLPVNSRIRIYEEKDINLYTLENNEFLLGYIINQKNILQKNIPIELDINLPGTLEWFDAKEGKYISKVDITPSQKVITVPEIFTDLAFKITYRLGE